MVRYARKPSVLPRFQRKGSIVILAFLWILGLVCGLYIVSAAGDSISSLMGAICYNRVSIVGLAAVLFLPLVITAIAAYFSAPALIYIFCSFKALCVGCCLYGVVLVFGYSAWLIRLLLFFSDSIIAVLILWLWYRYLYLVRDTVWRDLTICAAVAGAIGIIDYFLVSPYLVMLMNYYS